MRCKVGLRSRNALAFPVRQGFEYLKSVQGGISVWSEEIARNVPKYSSGGHLREQ